MVDVMAGTEVERGVDVMAGTEVEPGSGRGGPTGQQNPTASPAAPSQRPRRRLPPEERMAALRQEATAPTIPRGIHQPDPERRISTLGGPWKSPAQPAWTRKWELTTAELLATWRALWTGDAREVALRTALGLPFGVGMGHPKAALAFRLLQEAGLAE